jgi:hypothetical protein
MSGFEFRMPGDPMTGVWTVEGAASVVGQVVRVNGLDGSSQSGKIVDARAEAGDLIVRLELM